MKILLRLKHWQIFLLTAVVYVYFALSFLDILMIFSSPGWGASGRIVRLIGFVVLSLWEITLARELHKKLPARIDINIGLFSLLFYISFAYDVTTDLIGIIIRLVEVPKNIREIFYAVAIVRNGPMTLYYLMSFVLTIYFSYTISRLLNTVEKRIRSESGSDLIMLTLFPIGIWWIQPRVNKIFANESVFDPNAPLDQNLTQTL